MVQLEHVRAWLGASVGHLLMSVALTPPDQPEALVEATLDRLAIPLQIELPGSWANDFEERRLELLYNLRMSPEGHLVSTEIRVGQGEEWRWHWAWLSSALGSEEMLEAVRLAGCLMRCPPLLEGLVQAMQSGDRYLATVALAVARRWLLCLKAMAWLEDALGRPWSFTRPQDLACFAFSATKPDWPRRALAISHRSADAKPTLIQLHLWSESRCAIDATYVPSRETNSGMVWGLFAATPAIARISSPGYAQSLWCNREFEITQHLIGGSDFLSERWVLDLEVSELEHLDRVSMNSSRDGGGYQPFASPLVSRFPPFCNVWVPTAMPDWEVKMFRAGAALRLINLFLSDLELTNKLVAHLEDGIQFPGPAPTNNPGGWADYAAILSDLRLTVGSGRGGPSVRLPRDYGPEQVSQDLELSRRIPSMSGGSPALGDVLVAFEWLRTEWPAMLAERKGNLIAIDCRGVSKEQWEKDVGLSLLRGLAVMVVPVPVWFLQVANQGIDTWGFPGDPPIFTQHVPNQYSWMFEISFNRRESQSRYPEDSGLELSEWLKTLCKHGIIPT
jgi:hypothetical protein